MMEGHRCKLCPRSFANGKALGGHMRSHMMKLKIYAAKIESKKEDLQSIISDSSYSYSSEEDHDQGGVSGLQSYRLRDPKFVQDSESDTESPRKNPIHKRSNESNFDELLNAKKAKFGDENSPVSSISDTTSDEEVAYCLIMLSRDKWKRVDMEYQEKRFEEEEDDYSEDSLKVIKNKVRGKYRCETCNKLFRSYQALGGHRANHNKLIKVNNPSVQVEPKATEEKLHECPFCDRVFPSGQALGGHKRTHSSGAGAISANVRNFSSVKQSSRVGETLEIDLNFPAPTEEDDEISHVAISALSDAEFVP